MASTHVSPDLIRIDGSSDIRKLLPSPAPATFRWTVRAKLRSGRSAGVLFGMDEKGQEGYVARLDSRLGRLILAKVGPWPKEERLADFPWGVLDGPTVTFRVELLQGVAQVFIEEKGAFPLLEARNVTPKGRRVGLYGLDASAEFRADAPVEIPNREVSFYAPKVGRFEHFYDQGVGEAKPWYINDHCIIEGKDGWHLYGITHEQPADPMHERDFVHATAKTLDQRPWDKKPFALTFDPKLGENHLWAPHVIEKGGTYYMFYCAGSQVSNYHYRIHLATSKDLTHWTRYDKNPLFEDFYDARDPMVIKVGNLYHMYYTANWDTGDSNHTVNLRTSRDLLHWSTAQVVFAHSEKGTWGGPTESPFVVPYGDHFYLFVGPDSDYHRTVVYRSSNPYHWRQEDLVSEFPSHAAEVIRTKDGKYFATNSGWDLNGVYMAPMTWEK